MIRNLKSFLKYILFTIINLSATHGKCAKKGTLVLIRTDAIGDYVLFRNYIKELKNSTEYHDYELTLIGNEAWRELALTLDKEFIAHFIGINPLKFTGDIAYRYNKLKECTEHGYELLVASTYSRDFFVHDMLVSMISADKKIGNSGDLSNQKAWQKKISDTYYSSLIPASTGVMFEFYRNKEFFEKLLDEKIELTRPHIELPSVNKSIIPDKPYAVIFIGASAPFRKWSIKNYAEIGKYLHTEYGLEIVLCGAKNDEADIAYLDLGFGFTNLVGKTSLSELLIVINNSTLMISNETSAPHFAAALDNDVIVISNGNHFGRFTPYPAEIASHYHIVLHPVIEKNTEKYSELCTEYGYGSTLDINDITVERIRETIDTVMASEGVK